MARRTIQSPGVEIRESDLSLRTAQTGTTTYIAGFASEGPTDEVIGLGNISEFEQIYGTPKTPAERSIRRIKNSFGKCLTSHDANIPENITTPANRIIIAEIPSIPILYSMFKLGNHIMLLVKIISAVLPDERSFKKE